MSEQISNTRYGRSRGRIQNGALGISYPHPWFDIATTYMPQSIQSLFKQLREFFLLNGFFHTVIHKLAEYPITDLIFDGDVKQAAQWKSLFEEKLQYRRFQIEVGLDYYCYGNALVSVRYPLVKWLHCTSCKTGYIASNHRDRWSFRGYKFHLNCPKCGFEGEAQEVDLSKKTPEAVRLIRWDPEMVQIRWNPLTRERTYYIHVPGQLKADVMMGRKDIVEEMPRAYLDACQKNEMVMIPADEIYHLARPTISGFDPGWGCPLLLPVLKEAFQLQIMRKSNETVLLEHLVPLRVFYPQPASGTSDPFATVPLPIWKEAMAKEIQRWRWDPNYIPILPLPVGQQSLGGDGKALMIQPEMQAAIENMIVQMGVPKEFVFGGAQWSGSNVSLRTVENMFLGYILMQLDLVKFVQQKIALVCDWPIVPAKFKPFRMADDIQRKQWLTGLVGQDFISQTSFLEEADFDAKREAERRIDEIGLQVKAMREKQVKMAEMQAEVSMINAKAQIEIQKLQMQAQNEMQQVQQQQALAQQQQMAAQDPQAQAMAAAQQQQLSAAGPSFEQQLQSRLSGQQMPGMDVANMAQVLAQQIAALPQQVQSEALQNLGAQLGPELAKLVQQNLGSAIADGAKNTGPVSKPDPQKLPPRRVQS